MKKSSWEQFPSDGNPPRHLLWGWLRTQHQQMGTPWQANTHCCSHYIWKLHPQSIPALQGWILSHYQRSPRVHPCHMCQIWLWLMTWLLSVHCLGTRPPWAGDYLLGCFTRGFTAAPLFTCAVWQSLLPTNTFFLSWCVRAAMEKPNCQSRSNHWRPRDGFIFITKRGDRRNPHLII